MGAAAPGPNASGAAVEVLGPRASQPANPIATNKTRRTNRPEPRWAHLARFSGSAAPVF